MRFQFSPLLALALSLSTASAQSFTDVPICAYNPAIKSSSGSGCNITDLSCICRSQAWLASLLPEVSKTCSSADLEKTRSITTKLCKDLGVELQLPSPSSLGSSASALVANAIPTGNAAVAGYGDGQSRILGVIGVAVGMMLL